MRVALYYTHPAEDPLAKAAAEWLGRDAFTGEMLRQPPVDGIGPERLAELTGDPRRYGWHATLKAPFRLAEGRTLPELEQAVADFAAARGPLPLTLDLQRVGPFFALTPAGDQSAVNDFAADVVRAFEPFRAPLTEAAIARRRRSNLSPEQDRYLLDWGYPHVFDLFRLHMTLTGPVPDTEADAMEGELRRHFSPFLGQPGQLDALAIFVEPDASRDFLVHSRTPLIAHGAA